MRAAVGDDHVAGRAGAGDAAGVLEMNAVGEQDVEDRAGRAVVLERCVARVELDLHRRLAGLELHADEGHAALLAGGWRPSERRSLGGVRGRC
jgi:hypothetical protein